MKIFKFEDLSDDLSKNQFLFESYSYHVTDGEKANLILDKFLDLNFNLLSLKHKDELFHSINKILEELDLYIESIDEESFPFIYEGKDGIKVGLSFRESVISEHEILIGHLIKETFEKFNNFKNKLTSENPDMSYIEEAFQKIPFPVVVFTTKGEILLHNHEFSKLNILPYDVFEKMDNQAFFVKDETYKVKRVDWEKGDQTYILILLTNMEGLNQSKKLKVSSFSELGIMASSIAHELNNPLMGISAAITLLELNDELGRGHKKTLKEMKECTKRCSELVSVFLGFSKRNPQQDPNNKIGDAFKRALNLLRFRMVESNICLDISLIKKQKFRVLVNPSVITMVFYLILNEILTVHSKERLINVQWNSSLKGKLIEKESELLLSVDSISAQKIFEKMGSLGLIRNLLNIDGLELNQSDEGIILEVKNKNYFEQIPDSQQELPF